MKLKNIKDIGKALDNNPDLLTYFFKHPNFGEKLVDDPAVANEVIQHPDDFKEIAHRGTVKVKPRRKTHPIIFLGHKYQIDDVHIHLEDRAPMMSRSKLSLEEHGHVYDDHHILRSLLGAERVYMKHDEIVYDGCMVCCEKKVHRYFFLDVNGKVIYHIRDFQFFNKDFLRKFDYGVMDHDGNELLRMKKVVTITNKQKIVVHCPPGNYIGCITQSCGMGTPSFWVKNHENHTIIEIKCGGRRWKSYWDPTDHKFEFIIRVVSTQGDIGLISTLWFEKQMETFTFDPYFGIHWQDDLTLNIKGLLLSAMLIVYISHYRGRLDNRLYIERYNAPPRPSYSVFEEELDHYTK